MKKIVLNISDATYEKLKFEAIIEKKSISQLLHERILFLPFDEEVENAYQDWVESETQKIINNEIEL